MWGGMNPMTQLRSSTGVQDNQPLQLNELWVTKL
jgi:hypothetical protein